MADRCNVAKNTASELPERKQQQITIFHGDQDPYADQVDDIIGCLLDVKEQRNLHLTSYLVHGCGHGNLPECITDKTENQCFLQSLKQAIGGSR